MDLSFLSILLEPSSWPIILTLTLMEGVLSLDNATVIASMVKDLKPELRNKAISYGMIGAVAFRFAALFLVSYIAALHWVKFVGAIYLLWIVADYFFGEKKYWAGWFKVFTSITFVAFAQIDGGFDIFSFHFDLDILVRSLMSLVAAYFLLQMHKGLFAPFFVFIFKRMGIKLNTANKTEEKKKFKNFWLIVASVELTDLAFSLDNVVVAVGMSQSLTIITVGVVLGMITMRFAIRLMSMLLKMYPFMDNASHLVIGLVGVKMILSYVAGVYPNLEVSHLIHSHYTEIVMTGITLGIFLIPIGIIEIMRYKETLIINGMIKKFVSDGKIDSTEVGFLKYLTYGTNEIIDQRNLAIVLKVNEIVRNNTVNEKEGGHTLEWHEFFMQIILDYCQDPKQPFAVSEDEQRFLMKHYPQKNLYVYERKAIENLISASDITSDKFIRWAKELGVKVS